MLKFYKQQYIKLVTSGFLLFSGTYASAQALQIKVSDQQKNAIVNANIWIDGRNLGYTDKNGIFQLPSSTANNIRLGVSYAGYHDLDKVVLLDTVSKQQLLISLEGIQNLHEVVVTAGRKPESISTVPSSISILTAKDIEAQSQISTNLASILGNTVPGLGTTTNKATNAGQTLRGRSVLVLIDGIPQSTPLMNGARDLRSIDPSVIERVEIIKGATSIYGNGSAGGIINYITKSNDRLSVPIGGVTTMRSTLSPYRSSETAGYRIAQSLYGRRNKFSYTVSGSADYTALQRDADGIALGQTDGLSNSYQYNAFVKLGYNIDSTSSLALVYNLYNSTQHSRYISQAGVYEESPTIGIKGEDPGKPAGTPYNHNAMLTYTKNNLFDNTLFQVSGYYNTFRSMNRYVENATAWYGPGQTQINSTKKGLRINLNTPFQIGNFPSEVTYGLDLLNDVTNQDLTDGRVYIPNMNMVNMAPYAQVKIDFFENLIFKGGLRYENATVTIKNFNTIATGPNNEGSIAVTGGEIPYNGTMFNAGLRFNKYDFFNPFVSFSQGFAINELGRIVRRATNNDLDSLKTDPIITNNYEVGFSSTYSIFQLSAAYYKSTSKLGVELVDVGGYLMPQRTPQYIYGFEVALNARLSSNWTVGGTYAYVEGKSEQENGIETYINGSLIGPPKATGYVYFTPDQAWNIQLFWVHTGSRDRFDSVQATGKYRATEGPVHDVNLFNLNASYKINNQWSLGMGIENLFNTDYYTVLSQYRAENVNYVKGMGTIASLNINYKF
ncbi:TonB-dependent receptor [Sphingobacterium lumbrici]|uniref:TonB-dependent receptor n=1 Tax=Sphingobacterium lumbrici TaxID=2559600 RepID=UPI001129B52A|nr:TonB-dependent receptor [Sphingobacterium lumbrici]